MMDHWSLAIKEVIRGVFVDRDSEFCARNCQKKKTDSDCGDADRPSFVRLYNRRDLRIYLVLAEGGMVVDLTWLLF